MIYTRAYKLQNHKYGVASCVSKKRKTCLYIKSKYVNCEGSHQVNIFRCLAKQKVQVIVQNNKIKRAQNKMTKNSELPLMGKKKFQFRLMKIEKLPQTLLEIELDNYNNWVRSPEKQSSDLSLIENSVLGYVNNL